MSDMTKETVDVNRQADLREMVYHTDARVTAMEGSLSMLAGSVGRQEQKIDALINHLNKPKEINWPGWAAFGLAFIVSLFGAGKFVTEYNSLTDVPIMNAINELGAKQEAFQTFQTQTHWEFGETKAKEAFYQSEITKLWDHAHKYEDQIADLQDRLARSETARAAIGEYLRNLGAEHYRGVHKSE